MDEPPQYKKHEPVGPMVGIVIIIILVALGGVYFFAKQIQDARTAPPAEEAAQEA